MAIGRSATKTIIGAIDILCTEVFGSTSRFLLSKSRTRERRIEQVEVQTINWDARLESFLFFYFLFSVLCSLYGVGWTDLFCSAVPMRDITSYLLHTVAVYASHRANSRRSVSQM